MGDNLQTIVDEMRDDLRAGHGGFWCLQTDKLPAPLYVEVIPDGTTWIVMVQYGDRRLVDTAADPDAFLSELYVFIRRMLKEAVAPSSAPKPS